MLSFKVSASSSRVAYTPFSLNWVAPLKINWVEKIVLPLPVFPANRTVCPLRKPPSINSSSPSTPDLMRLVISDAPFSAALESN